MNARAIRLAGPTLILFLATVGVARAADRCELKPNFRQGQTWSFDQRGEMQQRSTMTAAGQPPQQMLQTMRQTRSGTVTVLAVNDGLPVSVRIAFGTDCTAEMEMAGQRQPIPVPFAGQTVTITRDAQGQVQHDFKGPADPMVLSELAGYLSVTRDSFPPHPLAVGEEWEPDTTAMRQAYQMSPQDRLSLKSRLVALKDFGGRRVAEVESVSVVTKRQGDNESQSEMRGTSLVDLATGNTLQSDITGTSTMRGTQPMQQPNGSSVNVEMQSQGTSRMQLSVRPLDTASPTPSPPANVVDRSPPALPAGNATGFVRFKKYSVQDRADGIGGEGLTFLCPAGWQGGGGMVWRDHPAMPATVHLRAFNPRGLEQLESLPTLGFSWGGMLSPELGFPPGSNYMGNEVRPPVRDAAQYIKEVILPRYRGNVQLRVVGEQELPAWAQAVAEADQLQQAAAAGVQAQCNAGKVRIEYAVNGQPVEEDIYAALVTTVYTGTMNPLYTQSGERVHAMRAAKGQLDERTKIMQTMVTSARPNLQWFNKYAQLCQTLHNIQMQRIKTAGKISQIISQTSNEISDMMMDSWNRRQASEDRVAKAWSQTIRGVDEYYNPVEQRPVELPSGYKDAWVNGAGEYVVSDNVNFNPNVELNGSWQKLDRAGN